MNRYHFPLLFCVCFCLVGFVQSQTRPHRYYATQEVMARLEKQNPELVSTRSSIERKVAQERSRISATDKITIPVVFHILYSSSVPSITEAQVMEQLSIVNADFTMDKKTIKHPADTLEKFIDRAAKVDIDFCLAKEKQLPYYPHLQLCKWETFE